LEHHLIYFAANVEGTIFRTCWPPRTSSPGGSSIPTALPAIEVDGNVFCRINEESFSKANVSSWSASSSASATFLAGLAKNKNGGSG